MAAIERNERLVPVRFDDYLDSVHARALNRADRCQACLEPAHECWRLEGDGNPMTYCEFCLRTMHGSDSTEEALVRGIIGAAVGAALDQGASPRLVRAAIDAAVDEHLRHQEEGF